MVSARELAAPTRRALRTHRGVKLLLEPQPMNTAAAIAWAAARIAAVDENALLGVFPADHHIPSASAFVRSVQSAARAALRADALVLIGIEPRRPDTGYGYLRLGERAAGSARRVRQFLEKPGAARARRLLRDGDCLWNAGMVVATAARILAEVETHAPEVWGALGPQLDRIRAGRRVSARDLASAYRRVRRLSFDYAVLERSQRVLAVRGRFRWSDLGSWDALSEYLEDRQGNAVGGTPPVALVDSRANVIWNTTKAQVALLGVSNLIIVQTADALLICPKDRAQEVRAVVEEISRRGRSELT